MNIKKLWAKAESFIDSEKRKRKEKRAYLKQVLEKLKKQEKALIAQLKDVTDKSERKKLKKEILLAHAQRKKGIKILKNLK